MRDRAEEVLEHVVARERVGDHRHQVREQHLVLAQRFCGKVAAQRRVQPD
jgi:hypothetical protein